MNDLIKININTMEDNISNINKLDFDCVWRGKTATVLSTKLDEIIKKLSEEKQQISSFYEALKLVDECKELDQKISRLKKSLIIPKEDDETDKENKLFLINNEMQINIQIKQQKIVKIQEIISSIIGSQNLPSTTIPSDISGTILTQYEYGAIYKFTTPIGMFEAYIPNNYNENTPLIIYEAGDPGNKEEVNSSENFEVFKRKFASEECNAIILRSRRQNAVEYYNYLADECNLNNNHPITLSHSGGTIYSIKEANQLINEKNDPSLVVIMDGYVPTAYIESEGIVQNLKEHETVVLAFAQEHDYSNYAKEYENLAKTGANVLILYDNSQYGQTHTGLNTSFIEANVLEYVTGEGTLPNNYTIKSYDTTNNKFVDVDISKISNIQSVYQYFGVNVPN